MMLLINFENLKISYFKQGFVCACSLSMYFFYRILYATKLCNMHTCMYVYKLRALENVPWHLFHSNGFFFVCACMWLKRVVFCAKTILQKTQLNGFGLLLRWTNTWCLLVWDETKTFPQNLHQYGHSLMCLRMWVSSRTLLRNPVSQKVHVNFDFQYTHCVITCVLKRTMLN